MESHRARTTPPAAPAERSERHVRAGEEVLAMAAVVGAIVRERLSPPWVGSLDIEPSDGRSSPADGCRPGVAWSGGGLVTHVEATDSSPIVEVRVWRRRLADDAADRRTEQSAMATVGVVHPARGARSDDSFRARPRADDIQPGSVRTGTGSATASQRLLRPAETAIRAPAGAPRRPVRSRCVAAG